MTESISRRTLLPVAAGFLLAAGTPPAISPLVPFVALVPLVLHLRRLSGPRAPLDALLAGGVAGALQHAWGLRWLPFTLGAVAGPAVGWLGFAFVILVLSAATGAATWGAQRLMAGAPPLPAAAAVPLAWVTLEWGLAHLPLGLAFPWAPLGLGLAPWPATLGLAELLGMGGVTLWLACVAGLLARAKGRFTAAALALAVGPVLWGEMRADRLDAPDGAQPVLRVAALSLPAAPADRTGRGVDSAVRALAALPGPVAMVALPEMLIASDPRSPEGAPAIERLAFASARAGGPLLVGGLRVDERGAFNSAFVVDSVGLGDFRADKRRLVPGVERASAVRAAWLSPAEGGYAEGVGRAVASLGGVSAGVLICYEVAFAADARTLARNGANVLVALTSDAWFGGGPGDVSGARGAGISQQTAHLVARAVETRRGAVRSSDGGPALVIAPSGRVLGRSDAGAAVAEIRSSGTRTLFTSTGDLVGPTLVCVFVALLLAGRTRGRHDSSRG